MKKEAFYGHLRKRDSGLFGTSLTNGQVEGLEAILEAGNGLPITYLAYLLATTHHETGRRFQPVREAFGASDADSVNRLERAWKAGKLKSVKTPYWRYDADGKAWFGRGYPQITHKRNYVHAAKLTGMDLVGNPSLAMIPKVSAKILVQGSLAGMFTGRKLADYLPGDYIGARKVINRTDKASLIAGYARSFEAALRVASYGSATAPSPAPSPAVPPPSATPSARVGGFLALLAAIAGVFALRRK